MGRYAVRKFIYGQVSEDEHALIVAKAKAAGISMSEWVRRAANRQLFEEDEDGQLLEELGEGRVRT